MMRMLSPTILCLAALSAYADCSYLDQIKISNVSAEMVPRSPYVTSINAVIENHDNVDHNLVKVSAKKSKDAATVNPVAGGFYTTKQNRNYTGAFVTPEQIPTATIPASSSIVWRTAGPNSIKLYTGTPYEGGNKFVPSQDVELKPLKVSFTFQDNPRHKCTLTVDKVPSTLIMEQTVNHVTVY